MTDSVEGTAFGLAAVATSPEDALRVAAAVRPDVALVAASLGSGKGMPAIDKLPKEHRVPVVLFFAVGLGPPSATLAHHSGVMGCLVEPVLSATLGATLEIAVCRFRDLCAMQEERDVLQQTIEARKVIERAKGLLMEVGRLSEREAYARIRRKSMDTQRPMTEIARAIIVSAEVAQRPN
jgi:response regulator NasT